jgi:monoamine oxidase
VAYLRGRRIEDYQPTSEEFWSYSAMLCRYPSKIERFSLRIALSAFQKIRKILGKTPWMTYRILDGTDRITEKLAAEINASFILGSKVVSINQEKKPIRLSFSSSEAVTSLDFDYVVCATPLSELDALQFIPQLPSKKKNLATEIPFSSAVRVFLQMKDRYWRRYGYNGFAVTDTIGEVWDPNFDVPKNPAMLVCYAQDELADLLSELDETKLIEYVLLELEKVFPGARKNFEYGVSFDWRKQSWIRGGWPHVRRFIHRVGEFRQPFDRVYFAGDYAAR